MARTSKRIALLLIDLQNSYFEFPELAAERRWLVARVNELLAAAQRGGQPVIMVRTEHSPDKSTWTLNMLQDDQGFAFPGSEQAAPLPELAIGDDTITVVKTRDDAFHGTDLAARLADLDVDGIVLCGVSTHSCVAQPPRPHSPGISPARSPRTRSPRRIPNSPPLCWRSCTGKCASRCSTRSRPWQCWMAQSRTFHDDRNNPYRPAGAAGPGPGVAPRRRLLHRGIPRDPECTLTRVSAGELRVGVSENPPRTKVADDGTVTGTEAEIVRGYAQSNGATITWTAGAESHLIQRLDQGEFDLVIGGLSSDVPWQSHAAYTRPYGTSTGPDGSTRDMVFATRLGEDAFLSSLERYLIDQGLPTRR